MEYDPLVSADIVTVVPTTPTDGAIPAALTGDTKQRVNNNTRQRAKAEILIFTLFLPLPANTHILL
jgi:hypothetical protein